ncbi:MAG: hypothetical protein J4215_05430 [Candidatus Diapherotrites archaeon]|uniref:Uncharacterized protein n=1 Tax=Candidatus Iainarchaeum sp. TaxID=3101447 RepID=A0A8T4LGH2_9ARCH|nr:hypothetical protein [Candidatus Diapherotrites archaeon]
MAGLEGLTGKSLKKTVVIFGLDDILVPGKVLQSVDHKKIGIVLAHLKTLSEKIPSFRFFLVCGYQKEKTFEKIRENKLDAFFSEENTRFVSQEFLDSKEPMDREIYDQQIAKDPLFKDEFFKQKAIDQIVESLNVSKDRVVFVGHDIWFDAFYSQRFSQVDFVLVKDGLANQSVPFERVMKGLNYIHLDWDDLRKVLLGKLPVQNLDPLKNFIHFQLQRQLVSSETMGKLVEARQKQLEEKARKDLMEL